MGKVTIEFDSNEEATDIKDALDGYKWRGAVWEIDQFLRGELKYGENVPKDVQDAYEKLREKIRDILHSAELTLEC
jgi:hypothetical protein